MPIFSNVFIHYNCTPVVILTQVILVVLLNIDPPQVRSISILKTKTKSTPMTYEELKNDPDFIKALRILIKRFHTFSRSELEEILLDGKADLETDIVGFSKTEVKFRYNVRPGIVLNMTVSAHTKTVNVANRTAAMVYGLLPLNEDVSDADITEPEIEFMMSRAKEVIRKRTAAIA